MYEDKTPIIDKEFQLGLRILQVKHSSNKRISWVLARDEATKEEFWQAVETRDKYPEFFTIDLSTANLTEVELRVVRRGIKLGTSMVSFAKRYDIDLTEPCYALLHRIMNIAITSKGRRMEAPKVARSMFTETKVRELLEQPILEKKGAGWKLFGG